MPSISNVVLRAYSICIDDTHIQKYVILYTSYTNPTITSRITCVLPAAEGPSTSQTSWKGKPPRARRRSMLI